MEEEATQPGTNGTGAMKVYPYQLIHIQMPNIVPPQLPLALLQGLPWPVRSPSPDPSNGSSKQYPQDYWDLSQAPEGLPRSINPPLSLLFLLSPSQLELDPYVKNETSETTYPSPLIPGQTRRCLDSSSRLSPE
jgi:hypothetical protein